MPVPKRKFSGETHSKRQNMGKKVRFAVQLERVHTVRQERLHYNRHASPARVTRSSPQEECECDSPDMNGEDEGVYTPSCGRVGRSCLRKRPRWVADMSDDDEEDKDLEEIISPLLIEINMVSPYPFRSLSSSCLDDFSLGVSDSRDKSSSVHQGMTTSPLVEIFGM
eukprot:gb/GEZN01013522.1/.p1 GENE.gb/GEZN01013522.1/~~gb/GEZN01013522.1/.p1  ORF type:complete len:167 (-),score=15.53 gb/GEZN01013522.1/:472-972(-)